MKLAYPALSDVITIDGEHVSCLVIENKGLFRSLICDISNALDGGNSELVLSKEDKILDISRYIEIISDFISFDLNKRTLINKIVSELERVAVSSEHYVKTQKLLAEIDRAVGDWAFSFPCDIVASKVSVSTLLKSVGVELRSDYEGHCGEVEKILDYMELVREFDRSKLFVTVNMRTYFDDKIMRDFMSTILSHEYMVLMLESQAYTKLEYEKRITIDEDLCEF